MPKVLEHPLTWMTLLHLVVSFSGLLVKGWKESVLHKFRMVGVGGLVAVLTLHLDYEHFHTEAAGAIGPLIALGAAFLLMVLAHSFPSHKSHHVNCKEQGHIHPFISYWWVVAILVHSVTDGYLLAASEELSVSMRDSIWAFLAVHKVLEVIWVSSLLALEFKKRRLLMLIGAYALTFPLGYLVPVLLKSQTNFPEQSLERIFQFAGAISMGSLLACVVVDQIIPSLKNVRKDFKQVIWFVLGFALTHGLLFITHGHHHGHGHSHSPHHEESGVHEEPHKGHEGHDHEGHDHEGHDH